VVPTLAVFTTSPSWEDAGSEKPAVRREEAVAMPVYCAYCGKSFTRKEHLERHIPQREYSSPQAGSLSLLTHWLNQTRTSSHTGAAYASCRLLDGKYLISFRQSGDGGGHHVEG